jgi:hypothetical protein
MPVVKRYYKINVGYTGTTENVLVVTYNEFEKNTNFGMPMFQS